MPSLAPGQAHGRVSGVRNAEFHWTPSSRELMGSCFGSLYGVVPKRDGIDQMLPPHERSLVPVFRPGTYPASL